MYVKPKLTIHDAEIDGKTVTGTFVFPSNVRYEIGAEMNPLFQGQGLTRVLSSVILDYVQDRGVDAVVMATHGRRGLERYILGSVTEKVLRTVDVPVLVVPLSAGEE